MKYLISVINLNRQWDYVDFYLENGWGPGVMCWWMLWETWKSGLKDSKKPAKKIPKTSLKLIQQFVQFLSSNSNGLSMYAGWIAG